MGIGELKRDIRERIVTYQYRMENEDIWELLDTYDQYLADAHTSDELAEAAFLRGEVAFHMGRYHDTVRAFSRSLGIEKSPEYAYLEANAYNMLGMLFAFVGYEDVALDNYLSAIESAKCSRSIRELVSAELNVGILYESLNDYRKAMVYYQRAYETANSQKGMPEIVLVLLCLIQKTQLLFKMQRYDEAKRMKREIDSYYQVIAHDEIMLPMTMLEVRMEEQFGTERRVGELIEEIRQYLLRDEAYLEQIDFYVDFCSFLMNRGRKTDARKFLDMLKEKLTATEFLHLRMRMEEMEVQYQRKYSDEEHYLNACVHYMTLQREYERTLLEFKQQNLCDIENLQEIENQRQEFEMRSKCDLITRLLNKETFQHEVANYLEERNRDVISAMVLIDIDNFKLINDSFGHLVGDEVVLKLASLMKECFGDEVCGRFGGDEFIVFIRDIYDLEQTEMRIEQFREAFADIGFGKKRTIHNTVSIGVSYNRGINASYKSMFSCADEALLKAKEYGKNRVAFFEIKRGILKHV